MKNPIVRKVSVVMFRAYIAWSICADIILIAGMVALLFGNLTISF